MEGGCKRTVCLRVLFYASPLGKQEAVYRYPAGHHGENKGNGEDPAPFCYETEIKDYRYSVWITNSHEPAYDVWTLCKPRANDENTIRELKEDFALGGFFDEEVLCRGGGDDPSGSWCIIYFWYSDMSSLGRKRKDSISRLSGISTSCFPLRWEATGEIQYYGYRRTAGRYGQSFPICLSVSVLTLHLLISTALQLGVHDAAGKGGGQETASGTVIVKGNGGKSCRGLCYRCVKGNCIFWVNTTSPSIIK